MAYVTLTGSGGFNGSEHTVTVGPVTDLKALDVFTSIRDHFSSKGGVVISVGETETMWVPSTWAVRMVLDRPLEARRDDADLIHGTIH